MMLKFTSVKKLDFKYKNTVIAVLTILLVNSCGLKVSSVGSRVGSTISGIITPFFGSIADNSKSQYLISDAYAAFCADPVYAKLYKIEENGTVLESSPLATQLIGPSAQYSFNTEELNLTSSSKVEYIVKAEGCNGDVYKRPVTSFDNKQDVDSSSTVVAEVINASSLVVKKLNEAEKSDVELLIQKLNGSNTQSALDSLHNSQSNVDRFTQIFGTSPNILADAKPEVNVKIPSNILNELGNTAFQVTAFHTDPNYSFAYKWKLDGVVKSSAATFNYIPGANEAGAHNIVVYVGKDDGTGIIDVTKPYYTKTFSVNVNNNILPVAPNISIDVLTPSPRNINNIKINIATGVALTNCSNFSHLAFSDTNVVPGMMQFNYNCSTAGTQIENITFSAGDGAKNIYIWAIDNEGNISSPKSVSLVLDTAPPVASISFNPLLLKGGTTQNIPLSASDAGVGMQDLKLYFTSDNSNYSLVSNLSLSASSHSWTVPLINTSNGKFKLVATDLSGSTTTVYSSLFSVDSTAPTSPSFSISTASPTSSTVVSATMSACSADVAQILLVETNVMPTGVESGWQNCSTMIGAHSITISGNGSHNLYVWSKDAAGNIASASTTQTIILDTTAPVISSGPSIATSMNKGGVSKTISWSVTDSTTATIALSYSIDNGSTYTSIASGLINNGSYIWNVPLIDSNQVNLKIVATDQVGISSQALSSVFIIDSTTPAVALTTPSGPLKGGSTITLNYSASDANTISTLELSYAADGVTFGAPTALTVGTSSYAWIVNSSDLTTAKLKITATDIAGNVGNAVTSAFTIDSTAPSAPALTRTSPAYSNSTAVSLTIGSCTDTSLILITETNTQPSANAVGWQVCSTGAGVTSTTITGEGAHTIYAWAKDYVGNVSTSANSVSATLDTTVPVIAVTTPGLLQGNLNTGSVSWSLTEANVSASTNFTIEIYNGTSWSSVGTKAAIAGNNSNQTYSLSNFSVPNVDVFSAKLRVSLSDAAGNSGSGETNAFTIDSTAPVLSSVVINDGASYAGTSMVNVKINVSDNISSGNQIKFRLVAANNGNGDCQSEYADNNWMAWTNSSTNFGFSIVPTDGIKKICAWAKDAAGNVTIMSPTNGTSGVNTNSIEFSTGNPPQILSFSAVNTSTGTRVANTGEPLTLSWSTSDIEGLDNSPISVAYTTDNVLWKDIGTNADISLSSNRTWYGNFSANPTSVSGTIVTFNSPSSSYFKLKIQSKDMAGNTSSFVSSQSFNTGNWSIYAGTRDRGDNGTGRAAALFGSGLHTHFAINPINGDIYAVDDNVGLRKLNASTGIVSTVIKHGTFNLPNNGALPANPAMAIGSYINPIFDSKGRLYVGVLSAGGYYVSKIYQIDFEASTVRHYAGGGVQDDGGSLATSLQVSAGAYSFDEQDSLYVWTFCGGAQINSLNGNSTAKRIVKIAQNTDGSPGTTTRVIGDCTLASPLSGATATTQPSSLGGLPVYAGIIPWDNGNNILVLNNSGNKYKIINGVVYTSNVTASSTAGFGIYNPADGLVYKTAPSGAGVEKISVNLAGANGDTVTSFFASNSTAAGCTQDGTLITSFCGLIITKPQIRSGILYFTDGAGNNVGSEYAIRYFDSSNQLRTVFGGQPFSGDGKDKSLMRGNFSGIYYKKSTEPNQAAFPEGLYFMERSGLVLGHINPTTGVVSNLWGNQARTAMAPVTGTTISKNLSMGAAYSGGNGMPLTFDSNGLPWLRANNDAISIDVNNKIVRQTLQSVNNNIQSAVTNVNPKNYGLWPYGGYHNFTLKGNGLFIQPNYVVQGVDPILTIRFMDFTNLVTPIIIGGNYLASNSSAASLDITSAGSVASAPLWTSCRGTYPCFMNYHPGQDRLYYAEGMNMRYITTPDNTATATLGTLFTSSSATITNFAFTPDFSQLWYFKSSGGLYCRDMTSGQSWCDNTTDYFAIRTTAGFPVTSWGPNQITFKDNHTMFVSTWGGEILQFNLPVGP